MNQTELGAEESHCCTMWAVSWVRIEHYASLDLNSYKAARAQTLSASQLNFVSWGSIMGQNEWGIKRCMGKDCSRLVEFKGSLCVCSGYIHSPFFCLTSESMLLSSATGTKKTHFFIFRVYLFCDKVLTVGKIACTLYQDRQRDKMRQTAGGNEKEKPGETGILWL